MNVSAIGNLFGVQQGPEKIDRKPAAETAGSLAFGTAETAGSLADFVKSICPISLLSIFA